jgi:hypothetical protein
MDRILINPIELLHVSTRKPHELTQLFIIPDGAGGVRKHNASVFDGTANSQLLTTPNMYRFLELLRIRGHGEGESLHGRKHGLLNINTITDKRVWDSLFDAQSGNGFTQAQVDTMWNNLIASRTVTMQQRHNTLGQPLTDTTGAVNTNPVLFPIPGATIYDMNAANNGMGVTYDRPFLPFGASQHAAGTGSTLPGGATAFMAGQGIDDTILRRDATTGLPHIFANTGLHPYQQLEALRKIQNNFTTTSSVFAVWVTVGYFEVEQEFDSTIPLPSGGFAKHVVLGKEYYRAVPADTRFQFFALLDLTAVGLDPAAYAINTYNHFGGRPFFTSAESNANIGTNTIQVATDAAMQVYSDGTPQTITPGMTLVIGTGANQEIVTVASAAYAGNGLTNVTIASVIWNTNGPLAMASPTFTRNHYAGETIANFVSGNPGVQTSFNVNQPMYQSVVPLWTRLR